MNKLEQPSMCSEQQCMYCVWNSDGQTVVGQSSVGTSYAMQRSQEENLVEGSRARSYSISHWFCWFRRNQRVTEKCLTRGPPSTNFLLCSPVVAVYVMELGMIMSFTFPFSPFVFWFLAFGWVPISLFFPQRERSSIMINLPNDDQDWAPDHYTSHHPMNLW